MMMPEQRITLPKEWEHTGRDYEGEPMLATYNVISHIRGQWYRPVTLRVYKGRSPSAPTVNVSLWARKRAKFGRRDPDDRCFLSASGSADSDIVHKESFALAAALKEAGIATSLTVATAGESRFRDTLCALAIALGYPRKSIYLVTG